MLKLHLYNNISTVGGLFSLLIELQFARSGCVERFMLQPAARPIYCINPATVNRHRYIKCCDSSYCNFNVTLPYTVPISGMSARLHRTNFLGLYWMLAFYDRYYQIYTYVVRYSNG